MAGRGRPPGQPKSGGRKKGTPNKKAALPISTAGVVERIKAQVEQLQSETASGAEPEALIAAEYRKCPPLLFILRMMNDESAPPQFRAEMAKVACVYLHSKAPERKPDTEQTNIITEVRRVIVQHTPQHTDSTSVPEAAWREPV